MTTTMMTTMMTMMIWTETITATPSMQVVNALAAVTVPLPAVFVASDKYFVCAKLSNYIFISLEAV